MFREFTSTLLRLGDMRPATADILNYDFLIAPGVIAMKDRSLMCAWRYVGPDTQSASLQEKAALKAYVNAALVKIADDGWMLNIDLIRRPSIEYPPAGDWPDPTTALIDAERRAHYTAEGEHYETGCYLALTFKPLSQARNWLLEQLFGSGQETGEKGWRHLEYFESIAGQLETTLGRHLRIERCDDDELLSYIETCITGEPTRLRAPEEPEFLDYYLGNHRLVVGRTPTLGGRAVRVVSVQFPLASHPEVTNFLAELGFPYRWSVRAILMAPPTAVAELTRYRRNHAQKMTSARQAIHEMVTGRQSQSMFVNQHALNMANDADAAIAEASSQQAAYMYANMQVVVTHEDPAIADDRAREVAKHLAHNGFGARIEDINAVEAWHGSLPGHGDPNVRRPILSTRNLADLMPTSAAWAGLEYNPNPAYPPNTSAMIYCSTQGRTPFRFHPHVSDVGHLLLLGPTGAGKSSFLALLAAGAFRVPDMQVIVLDKGMSMYALTKAVGGEHWNVGEDDLSAMPLADIHDMTEAIWAADYVETLLKLQNVKLGPGQRKAIWQAITLMREAPRHARTFTELAATIQDTSLKEALAPYLLTGALGRFLDCDEDTRFESRFVTFELDSLMAMGESVLAPVLIYLFHRIDQKLNGRPTLILIDEAWKALMNDTLAPQLEEWLRTTRKRNAAVVLATQSGAEIKQSAHYHVIVESCPTKVFLPNPVANTPIEAELYREFGLTDAQIQIIAEATPKHDYYAVSPLGRRLFQLALEPVALSFVGASRPEDIAAIRAWSAKFGEEWPYHWLCQRGLTEWAEHWMAVFTPDKTKRAA